MNIDFGQMYKMFDVESTSLDHRLNFVASRLDASSRRMVASSALTVNMLIHQLLVQDTFRVIERVHLSFQ